MERKVIRMELKIEHIAIVTKDMDTSIKFYSELIGYKVRLRGNTKDKELAFLYLEQQPGIEIELIKDLGLQKEYNKNGIVNHLAFTVDDIDHAIKEFKEKNVIFQTDAPNTTLEGGRMILFEGPYGELLQLVERVK